MQVSRSTRRGIQQLISHRCSASSARLPCATISSALASTCNLALPSSNLRRTTRTRTIMTSSPASVPWEPSKFPYPKARREEHYDTYKSAKQGKDVKVLDAYRWLEEPPNKSKETEAFVEAQAELTQKYLAQDPHREALKEKLTENWNYARCQSPRCAFPFESVLTSLYSHRSKLEARRLLLLQL